MQAVTVGLQVAQLHSDAVGSRALALALFLLLVCGFLSAGRLAVAAPDITSAFKAEKESKSFPRIPSPPLQQTVARIGSPDDHP